jgi:hypothetical protein
LDADFCSEEVSELDGLTALGCLTSGLEDIPLSEEAETYCGESIDKLNACLGEPAEASPLGSCEDTIALASDEYLAQMNQCANLSCEQLELCLSLVLLNNFPAGALSSLEEGEALPAAAIADLLATAVVFGGLGGMEELSGGLEGSLDDLLGGGDSSGMAGAPGR